MVSSNRPFKRSERVQDQIRRIASDYLLHGVPHLGLENVAITAVNVSDDLRHATIFFRCLNPKIRGTVMHNLARVASKLRSEVAHQTNLKYVPKMQFEYDDSIEYGSRIEELLSTLKTESDPSEE